MTESEHIGTELTDDLEATDQEAEEVKGGHQKVADHQKHQKHEKHQKHQKHFHGSR